MRISQAVLGLAATASAIDINLHEGGNCDGNLVLSCQGINSNVCCGREGAVNSVAFAFIPFGWNLHCRGHSKSIAIHKPFSPSCSFDVQLFPFLLRPYPSLSIRQC